jgi:hypothetical protein
MKSFFSFVFLESNFYFLMDFISFANTHQSSDFNINGDQYLQPIKAQKDEFAEQTKTNPPPIVTNF